MLSVFSNIFPSTFLSFRLVSISFSRLSVSFKLVVTRPTTLTTGGTGARLTGVVENERQTPVWCSEQMQWSLIGVVPRQPCRPVSQSIGE